MTAATAPSDPAGASSAFGEGRAPQRLTPARLQMMIAAGPDMPALITPDGRVFWADGRAGEPCRRFSVVLDCHCRLDSDGPGQACAAHARLADWPQCLYGAPRPGQEAP